MTETDTDAYLWIDDQSLKDILHGCQQGVSRQESFCNRNTPGRKIKQQLSNCVHHHGDILLFCVRRLSHQILSPSVATDPAVW